MSISCNIRISDCINGMFKGKDFMLPPNETWQIKINYPLTTPYIHNFDTGKGGAGFLRVVKEIGKAYKHVYKHDECYGIWGHSEDDLGLEGINIYNKKKLITIDVGS